MAVRRAARWAGRGVGLVAGGTAAFTTYKYNTDPGARRTMQFSWKVTPLCIAYGKAASRQSTEEEKAAALEALHAQYAPEVLRIVLELKGYYIKAAQMLCGAGLLPEAYERELCCLLDAVPPRAFAEVRAIVEQELGPLDGVFARFDERPLGAASIGQAHRATLKDGSEVVVKVQYPEVKGFFHLDLGTIQRVCALCLEGTDQLFAEVGRSFESEFDYRLEAENLRTCAANLAKAGFGARAVIPRPVDALCTERVLVMEALEGEPVKRRMQQVLEDMAAAQGKTVKELTKALEAEYFSDPQKLRQAPSETQVRLGLALLWLRDGLRNGGAALWNHTLGLGGFARIEYARTTTPPNGPALTKLLYAVHGHQVLFDGVFNADPHAGNVLVLNDGRLGLLDYGNAPTLTAAQRTAVAELVVALDAQDDPRIVRALRQMGYRLQGGRADEDRFLLMSAYGDFDQQYGTHFFNARFGYPADAPLGDVFERMTKEYQAAGVEVKAPAELINLQRCLMTLNGVATMTGAGNPRPSAMWRPMADKLLRAGGAGGK